ncbi:serine hydrolase domain-containing protein [Acerihabitans arboris]|uniref:Serine hydrolase n=1 Tax=Acerihabitans arboris TaxID=2691583 RepID=A0A845SHF2_9GAMM|nr:serine hydrolase domain-containing protein [Acerihabitans arboris]NDL63289.1 serine hydrolase [Acerihabitans arboris]
MSGRAARPDWQRAGAAAAAIAAQWARPGEPGGAIVLFDSERIQSVACGGLADLARGEPFSLDSVTHFASVSKHLFAALVTGLAGQVPPLDEAPAAGIARPMLALDDELARHLPQLRGAQRRVTVGQALDMTSGLPDARETLSLLGISAFQPVGAAAALEFLAGLTTLNYPAGGEISYTNTGYRLVEEALRTRGIGFNDILRRHICQPLDIALRAPETWFDVVPGLAPGYWFGPQGWQLAGAGLHLSAAGSVMGSARHLTVWLQSLLADSGPGRGVLDRLCAPRFLADGRPTDYGLGIAHSRIGNRDWVGHGGSHLGYKSYFLLDRSGKTGMAMLANRDDVAGYPAALAVMSALHGQPLPAPGHDLRPGRYAALTGGDWLEVKSDSVTWMGADQTLYPSGEPGVARSLTAHLPMRLFHDGAAIRGEIGHVPRVLYPVAPDACLQRAQGAWRHAQYRSELVITGDRLEMGIGPAALQASLTPLGGGRLLACGADGAWSKKFVLVFNDNCVQVQDNRSRTLTFQRQ